MISGKEISVTTGLVEGESLYVFSTPYDAERECVGFIFQSEREIAFATTKEEAIEKLRDMEKCLGERVLCWKLVPENLAH